MKLSASILLLATLAGCRAHPEARTQPSEPNPLYVGASLLTNPGDDSNDNIIGIVDCIRCRTFPADTLPVVVVARFTFSTGAGLHETHLTIVDAYTGETMVELPTAQFRVKPQPGDMLVSKLVRYDVPSLRCKGPTVLHAVVWLDGSPITVAPIEVASLPTTHQSD